MSESPARVGSPICERGHSPSSTRLLGGLEGSLWSPRCTPQHEAGARGAQSGPTPHFSCGVWEAESRGASTRQGVSESSSYKDTDPIMLPPITSSDPDHCPEAPQGVCNIEIWGNADIQPLAVRDKILGSEMDRGHVETGLEGAGRTVSVTRLCPRPLSPRVSLGAERRSTDWEQHERERKSQSSQRRHRWDEGRQRARGRVAASVAVVTEA